MESKENNHGHKIRMIILFLPIFMLVFNKMASESQKRIVLIGDIGGTNSRISLVRMSDKFGDEGEEIYKDKLVSKDFPDIVSLLKKFLEKFENTENYPIVGVLGIPGPVFNNEITIIANLDWPSINGESVAETLNMKKFIFLNDFVTNGYGILSKIDEQSDYIKLNNYPVDTNGPIAMIGAGTGLGHGYLVKNDGNKYYSVFPSEGGHQDFSPKTEREWKYMTYLQNHFNIKRISLERACAGPALPLIFKYLATEGIKSDIFKNIDENFNIDNETIIKYGLSGECKICAETVDFFNNMYGSAAGNMCLIVIPTGGLYLLGGLSYALESHIKERKVFMDAFMNKGRLAPLLEKIPIFLVRNQYLGVKGAKEYARRILESLE